MQRNEPYIQAYDGEDNSIGVSFYGEWLYPGENAPAGRRSYKFRLRLSAVDGWEEKYSYLNSETFEFVHTMDLRLFPMLTTKFPTCEGDEEELEDWTRSDWEAFVQELHPELYAYLLERLERKATAPEQPPVLYTSGDWHRDDEFLVFTDDTAWRWSGPFEQDGKQGCVVEIRDLAGKTGSLEVGRVAEQLSWYNVPYHYRSLYRQDNTEQHAGIFDTLTVTEQVELTRHYLTQLVNDPETFERAKRFKLTLFGNDDTTYSRYFETQAEADTELVLLRRMQPLDFGRDILERNYIFTN